MEYEKIKQLMEVMGNSKLSSVNIDFPDGTKISMKKENEKLVHENTIKEPTMVSTNTNIIKSPMVGTVYLKPSPNSQSYIEIGSKVQKGQTVCIVEAMKLMNEIESEFSGEIIKILVKDGEAVEYGTPLFEIK